ncbi:hypothetical protein IWW50_000119 [Coemansia erecta]|nr:hypothetical protein IWW50_000119 [Coemansia erecta]
MTQFTRQEAGRASSASEQLDESPQTLKETPLPWTQLGPLLAIRLAEPVNMTLCMPFLYKMIESFDIAKQPEDVPFYAGLLLTSYSLFQAIPSMYWGVLSDRIGRRPTLLIGLAGDLATFVLFGLSKSFTWAIVTRSLNGVFASNSAVVKCVVAEVADDTNRPRMMALLPLMWNIGVIAGSAVGGLLADPANKYPSLFGHVEIFRTFQFLLPCLVGSLTTAMGLVVGLFKLKETLVVEPATHIPEAQEDGTATESTPLISQQHTEQQQRGSVLSLLTPTCTRVLTINVLMCLAISMYYHIYSMFAASPPSDGGLGFSTQGIGISLAISGLVVIYLQLVTYPALVHKYGNLWCCQRGLMGMIPVFFAIPFLSLLSARVERLIGERAVVDIFVSESWTSRAGLEYCVLWTLLLALLLARMVGDIMAFTSINMIVSNIAPSKTTLGAMNGMQQLSSTCTRIIGPLFTQASKEASLPWDQLIPLLAIRLAEPMVEDFDIAKRPEDVPFYAGLLLTSYSFFQAIPSLYWGILSDRIGRRPTLLIGLAGDLGTFVLFGLSKSFTWAIVTRSLNGVFTGNSAVVKSVIAGIADDSNRPLMNSLLTLMWNVGVVAGAAVGGLLTDPAKQYPGLFGHIEIFKTFPYLLPCLAGSVTTAMGLIVGIFRLKETLVIEPVARIPEAREDGTATESTPLIAHQNAGPPSISSLMTPTLKHVLATNLLMSLAMSIFHTLYPLFAATLPSNGGLGFSPREIGISLTFRSSGNAAIADLPVPESWISFAGLEYGGFWMLLAALLFARIIGDVLSSTSINIIVSNVAPTSATLGVVNGLQQLGNTWIRVLGPVAAGSIWGWSIKHDYPYPFNSHLTWIIGGMLTFAAWHLSRELPSSVNIFASGQAQQRNNNSRSSDQSQS